MDSVSTLLGGHAAPQVLEHEGKTYRCGAFVQERKSAFERALVARAKSFCETASERNHVVESAAKGVYAFFGEAATEFRGTVDGLKSLVSILFDVSADVAEMLILERSEDVASMIDLALLESLPRNQREKIIAKRREEREVERRGASEEAPLPA